MRVEDAVVVGIDGGELDRPLLGWAVEEAVARKAPVLVCHLWEGAETDRALHPLDGETGTEAPGPERLVRAAVETVRHWNPDVVVSAAVGHGRAAPALLRLSEDASMVVVGAQGSGGLRLGSVSAHVAMHAHCPVAVVQRPSTVGAVDVVAGVDGWPESERTVRLAADEARRLGGKLVLIHAYRLPAPAEYGPNAGIDEPHHRAAAEDVVDRAVAGLGTAGTDLEVAGRVVHGSATAALLDAAAEAAVLVVGARGRGGFAALLLGSVSQHVLRHAPCTVVVAR